VRVTGIDRLANLVSNSLVELGIKPLPSSGAEGDCADDCDLLLPLTPWAVPRNKVKAMTGRAVPAWRDSYDMFSSGLSLEVVALQHPKGVQIGTIVGHLFDAFLQGQPLVKAATSY